MIKSTEQELLAKRKSFVARRERARLEIIKIDKQLQQMCAHNWSWEQVAGDGRTCTKCRLRDYNDD